MRGVPRIEESLSLSEKSKNPSLTIRLKPEDESNIDRANSIMTMIEYTTLRDLISTIEITFDPKIKTNTHDADDLTTVQYYEFEKIVKECNQEDNEEPDSSPWIIYMVLNPKLRWRKILPWKILIIHLKLL